MNSGEYDKLLPLTILAYTTSEANKFYFNNESLIPFIYFDRENRVEYNDSLKDRINRLEKKN